MTWGSGVIFQRIFSKMTMTFAVMVFVLCCAGAESSRMIFENISVTPEFADAPTVRYNGVPMSFAPKVKYENKWLVLRIKYHTPMEKALPKRAAVRGNGPRIAIKTWLDDVTLSVRVLMSTGVRRNGKPVYVMFSGSCTYWTVRMDGKDHVAVMFVPAIMLDRYTIGYSWRPSAVRSNRSARIDGVRASGKVTARDFVIEAVFTSKGQELGRAYYNTGVKGKLAAQSRAFNALVATVSVERSVPGGVISREKSPWALYESGNFEVEKPVDVENK